MIWTVPKNSVSTTLGVSHAVGATSITVAAGTGSMFGTITPASPMRITVVSASDSTQSTIFHVTGRTGDVLSGLTVIEGTTDRNYAAGAFVRNYLTAGEITDLQAGINASATLVPDASTRNVIQPTGNFVPLAVKANAAQAVNLLEVQSSAGTALASINANGRLSVAGLNGGYSELAPDPKAIVTNFWIPRDPNLNNFCFFDYQDELAFADQKGAATSILPAPNSTTTPDGAGTNTIYRDNWGYCTWGATTSPYPIVIEIDRSTNPIDVAGRNAYQLNLTFRSDAYGNNPTNIKFESWQNSTSSYQVHFDGPPSYSNTVNGQNCWLEGRFASPGTSGNVYKLRITLSGTNPLPAGQNLRLQRVMLYHTTAVWDSWHLHIGGGTVYGMVAIHPPADTTKGLSIKSNSSSQSANLFETLDQAGAVMTAANHAGQWTCQTLFVAGGTAAVSSPASLATFRMSAASSTTPDQTQGKILSAWTVNTHATRAADVAFYASDFTGDREVIRLRANGSAPLLGFFGVTPVVRQTGGALTAAATYGANEQTMLQRAYNALRNYGLIT